VVSGAFEKELAMKISCDDRSEAIVRSAQPEKSADDQVRYREPQMVALGTAAALLQRDINGHLIDGTGGWWVWGS
jgi:hypothetical protein